MLIMELVKVGHQVYKPSGNPFKSGNKVGTVESYCSNLQDPKRRLAYVLVEDQSIVNADKCKEFN